MDRDAKKMSPEQEVEAAKERLRASLRRVSEELGRGVDEAQQRVVGTAQQLQERLLSTLSQATSQVQDTAGNLTAEIEDLFHKPVEAVRQRPYEAVATSLLAGAIVGYLTSRPAPADGATSAAHGEARAASSPRTSLLSGLVAGGVGKTVWDVVQKEYLTPENIRYWLDGLLASRRPRREGSWTEGSSSSWRSH